MPNWIFQANPGRYDLVGPLERGEPPTQWSIGRHRDDVQSDDRMAVWVAGPQAGVYAIGRVTGSPYQGRTGTDWVRPEDRGQEMLFCPIEIDDAFPHQPILKTELVKDPRFTTARIVSQPQAASPFLTTDDEWDAIEDLRGGPPAKVGRNPTWAQDELILALDLYLRHGLLDDTDPLVIELSDLLNRLPIHTVRPDIERFRNPNGVALKLANFAALDPAYPGAGMGRGGKRDAEVFDRFQDSRDELHRIADELRLGGSAADLFPVVPEDDEDEVDEGRLLFRRHRSYERDRTLAAKKKAAVTMNGAPLACEVCGFVFADAFGELGRDFIECHHRVALSEGGPTKSKLSDLALLYSNCHRMAHRRKPWPTVEELRAIRMSALPGKN